MHINISAMDGLWTEILTFLGLVGSNGVTWFFTRRKYNSEVDNTLIDNMRESLEFYKSICDDNKARLDQLQAELEQFRTQVNNKQKEIDEKQKHIDEMQKRLDSKQGELEELQNMIMSERNEKSLMASLACMRGECEDKLPYPGQADCPAKGKGGRKSK